MIALWYNPKGKSCPKRTAATLVLLLLFSISIPHLTALLSYNTVLRRASSIDSEAEKATFISDFVCNTTYFNCPYFRDYLRAHEDFWKFLIVGVGACGEAAMATRTLLDDLNMEARKVSFPGEDHAFVEVRINGDWL